MTCLDKHRDGAAAGIPKLSLNHRHNATERNPHLIDTSRVKDYNYEQYCAYSGNRR